MDSCIYKGDVSHTRIIPKINHFRYKIFMMCVDIENISGYFASQQPKSVIYMELPCEDD